MSIEILGLNEDELKRKGAVFTAKEIYGQPNLWKNTFQLFNEKIDSIKEFLFGILNKENLQIILTGAGTSAFIGEVLAGPLQKNMLVSTRAIPTTDLVTHPELYIRKDQPTMLISFARSGNSPESVKAIELANIVSNNIFHLIITCNPEGKLAQKKHDENSYVFILPQEADDKSLAMTGSFSSMLLTGLFLAYLNNFDTVKTQVELLSKYALYFFDNYIETIKEIANLDFQRAVFLGSGLFNGIARESHLKLQELTDGKIICKYDSFLGFRHGPKAVIDDKTLIVYLFSNNAYVQQYEIDLVKSIYSTKSGCYKVGVMEKEIQAIELNKKIIFTQSSNSIDEEFLTVASVLFAQTLGFYKSLRLELKPDSPSVSGMIHRVVQGVNLYQYNGKQLAKK